MTGLPGQLPGQEAHFSPMYTAVMSSPQTITVCRDLVGLFTNPLDGAGRDGKEGVIGSSPMEGFVGRISPGAPGAAE